MGNLGIDAAITECNHKIESIRNHLRQIDNGLRHYTENEKGELNLDCTSGEKAREQEALNMQYNYLKMYQNFKENNLCKTSHSR
ncbi:hypothetical protein SAMN05421890_3930 [Ensifer adhaerens]|nr:hypothetical protein SAMN05421890_3930 [Ensifer adhaerens]